jgi:hypothetical protein
VIGLLARLACLALGVLSLFAGIGDGAGPPGSTRSRRFEPYVPRAPQQRAAADFDADGHADIAFIDARRDGTALAVRLSSSQEAVTLPVDAVGVAADDVDHDGDVDLVVLTSSNRVVIWINDGHGHFTEGVPAGPDDPTLATTMATGGPEPPVCAGCAGSQFVLPRPRFESLATGAASVRANGPFVACFDFLVLLSERAPPVARRV